MNHVESILTPTSGRVYFRDKEIDNHFKKKVDIQFPSTALPEFTKVKEAIELFRSFYHEPRTLEEIVDRDNRKLSGGQRRRVPSGQGNILLESAFPDSPGCRLFLCL